MAAYNARIRKNAPDKQNLKTLLKDGRREPQATPTMGLPSATLEVRDLQTALVLVAAGEALCIAPDGAGLFAHPGIVFRPIREPVFAPLILCWRLGDVSPAVTAFLRAVDETLRRPA